MVDAGDWKKIVAGISDEQVLKLEQAAIRIPSTTFEEGTLADYLANHMSDLGLDVEMLDVTHWAKPGKKTRQPIARLRGTGGGRSLMLNGHMDPGVEMSGWSVDPYGAKFEDGWVWGMGAHDDKGGVVAAICAVEAIVRAGVRLRGDVVVCPVGWRRFPPPPELPGSPTHTFDTMHKEHYYQKSYTGMSSRECEMIFQLRTVPGQTLETVRADVQRLLADIKKDHPAFDAETTIPANGMEDGWFQDPMEVKPDHPLVTSLAEGQRLATGAPAVVGGWGRLGNVGDGNILMSHGIPTVQYGAGDIRIYTDMPKPDERVPLRDLVTAAKAIAYATHRLCAG